MPRWGTLLIFLSRAESSSFWSVFRTSGSSFFYIPRSAHQHRIDLAPAPLPRQLSFHNPASHHHHRCLSAPTPTPRNKGCKPTWTFPSLSKNSCSLDFFSAFSRAKYFSSNLATSTPLRSTTVEVAMTYRALTRRSGTPLILNGPVTSSTPFDNGLRYTTRLPRKRPARMMSTAPGVSEGRSTAGRTVLRTCAVPQSPFVS